MGGYKDTAELAIKCESRAQERKQEIIRYEQPEKIKRMLLPAVIGLVIGAGIALYLAILAPAAIKFYADAPYDSPFSIPIIAGIILIPLVAAIIISVKTGGKGGCFLFIVLFIALLFGGAAYSLYVVPFMLKASNILIVLMVGGAAIIGAGIGALIGAKR